MRLKSLPSTEQIRKQFNEVLNSGQPMRVV